MTRIREPSVKSILIEMGFNGTKLATGTGFIVQASNGPVLVTNRHNLTGRRQDDGKPLSTSGGVPNEVSILHNVSGKLGSWAPKLELLYTEEGIPKWKEHPVLGAEADIAALPLTSVEGVEMYTYDPQNVGTKILVGPADVVSVIGFPFGITAGGAFAVWATGFMASEPDVDFGELPVFLIDCRSRPGQSGSPVIAYRNGGWVQFEDGSSRNYDGPVERFLGIYSGRLNEQSDIGIVWKASAISELIQSM